MAGSAGVERIRGESVNNVVPGFIVGLLLTRAVTLFHRTHVQE